MKCPYCGKENPEVLSFCVGCGASLPEEDSGFPGKEAPPFESPAAPSFESAAPSARPPAPVPPERPETVPPEFIRQTRKGERKPRRTGLILGLGFGGAGLVAAIVVVVLLVGGKGCSWSEGSLTASGPPIGDVTYTPVKCRSGQREAFFGAMLVDGAGKVLIRVVIDPVRGTLVGVQKKDSCRGSLCEYAMIGRDTCAVFEVSVENTNTTVNDIRVVKGYVRLDCVFKDTGGTVKADLKFKCD